MLSVNQSLGTATNIYQTVTGEAENIDFGKLLGFRASWAFTPMISAEFNVSRGNNPYSFSVDDDTIGTENLADQFETDQLFLGGNILFQFRRGNFVPYVTGGGGLQRTTPTSPIAEIERVSAFDINFGGGPQALASKPGMAGRTRRPALSHGDGRHHVSWRLVDAERTRAHHRRFLHHFLIIAPPACRIHAPVTRHRGVRQDQPS